LQAAGERVALLALIDAEVSRPLSQAARLAPFRQPDNAARWRYLVRRATSYSARFRRRVFDRRFARAAEQVRACCQAAERAYVPRFYSGRIVLFRASQTPAATGLEPWRDLASSVEVFELSGDHSSILQPPEVERLAQQLCAAIDFAWLEHVRQSQVAC
jgi:thioesterase domain-containing protein